MKTLGLTALLGMALIAFGAGLSAAQPAQPATLQVRIEHGTVVLEPEGVELTPQERNALRGALRDRVAESPFRSQGSIEMKLRGELLSALVSRLRQTDLEDSEAVAAALDGVWEQYAERSRRSRGEGPGQSTEVVVGRSFTHGADASDGSLVAVGSHGVVEGALTDLVVIGSDVRLGPSARVTGNLITIGSRLDADPGAQITGQELAMSLPELAALFAWGPDEPAHRAWGARMAGALFGLLASLLLGLLYVRLFPRLHEQAIGRLSEHPWQALGYGLLHCLAILPVAFVLILSIIGILLVPLYFMLVGLLLWVAYVTSALRIGRSLTTVPQPWKQLVVGLLPLQIVGVVPVLGPLILSLVTLFGLGALMLSIYRVSRKKPDVGQGSFTHAQLA